MGCWRSGVIEGKMKWIEVEVGCTEDGGTGGRDEVCRCRVIARVVKCKVEDIGTGSKVW